MTYKEFQFTISTPDTESKSYSIRLHNGFNKWHCIQYVNESGEPHREDSKQEEGEVDWLNYKELISDVAPFKEYNKLTFDKFNLLFPDLLE